MNTTPTRPYGSLRRIGQGRTTLKIWVASLLCRSRSPGWIHLVRIWEAGAAGGFCIFRRGSCGAAPPSSADARRAEGSQRAKHAWGRRAAKNTKLPSQRPRAPFRVRDYPPAPHLIPTAHRRATRPRRHLQDALESRRAWRSSHGELAPGARHLGRPTTGPRPASRSNGLPSALRSRRSHSPPTSPHRPRARARRGRQRGRRRGPSTTVTSCGIARPVPPSPPRRRRIHGTCSPPKP